MLLKVWYDGFELTKYFTVRRISPLTPARVNNFLIRERVSGGIYRNSRNEGARLEIEATIKDNVLDAMDELNKILYSAKEPKPLVISDRPNRKLLCVLDGSIQPSSRFIASDITLTFVSPYSYWIGAEKTIKSNSSGVIEVNNEGTADTEPKFEVKFKGECGYLALVSPWGHVGVGNAKELDKIPVPPTEDAINDRLTSLEGWSRIGNAQNYITDYIGMTSLGTAGHDDWGMIVNRGTFNNQADKWQGHSYTKPFRAGQVETVANNFVCRVGLDVQDTSGATNRTCALLIVVMDEQHKPIMTTSVYDVSSDRNWLSTSFKVNSLRANDQFHSSIIHTGNIGSLLGHIEMKKIGDRFEWLIHSHAQASTVSTQDGIRVGDTVYIKDSARYGYHYNGTAYNIAGFTRGRAHRVTSTMQQAGRTRYVISYGGHAVYVMNPEDLQHNRVTQKVIPGGGTIRHSITHPALAQMKPHRVFIWQAVWGNSLPYSRFGIHTCHVQRVYTTNALEVENVFRPNDVLTIDCKTADILLNGDVFQGHVDLDSRFFGLEYGKSEIQVYKSDWAQPPDVTMRMEERYI